MPAPIALFARARAIIHVQVTGLHREKDRLWEIAGLRVEGDALTRRNSWLLNPGQALPMSVSRRGGVLIISPPGHGRAGGLG